MKKVIRLTESDLTRIVKRVIMEQQGGPNNNILLKDIKTPTLQKCLTDPNNFVYEFKSNGVNKFKRTTGYFNQTLSLKNNEVTVITTEKGQVDVSMQSPSYSKFQYLVNNKPLSCDQIKNKIEKITTDFQQYLLKKQ